VYKTDLGTLIIADLAGSERLNNTLEVAGDAVQKSHR